MLLPQRSSALVSVAVCMLALMLCVCVVHCADAVIGWETTTLQVPEPLEFEDSSGPLADNDRGNNTNTMDESSTAESLNSTNGTTGPVTQYYYEDYAAADGANSSDKRH